MTAPYPVPAASTEPLGSVTRVLSLREAAGSGDAGVPSPHSVDAFEADSLAQLSGRVYGGQVVAQALLAAAATLPEADDPDLPARLPHSVHACFMRGGMPEHPIRFEAERLHDGRSFSQRRVTASQEASPLLTLVSSFQLEQEGADVALPAPDVPRPEELRSALEVFREIEHPVARFLGRTVAFDLRHVEGNVYLAPGPSTQGRQHLWVRSRGPLPAGTSQTVHRALLAYMCDQVMLEPALRSQGLSWRTAGMSLATLDHAQWFHRDVDVCDWLLFVQDSPSSSGGRAMVRSCVYDSRGQMVSTIAQEGMIRVPTATTKGSGDWEIRLAEETEAPSGQHRPEAPLT